LLALGISSVVVILTMQRISKPVLQLVGVAQRIASRDFSVRMQAEAKDEIGLLIVAFNAMAAEINRRYEELENFAYIVAHDLKSPLNGIRGMSEILVTDYKDKLGDDAKGFLEAIVASSDRMAVLINDLLAFAKAGKVEYSSEAIPMGKIVKEVESDLAFYLKERNAILNVQENLPSIMCDPVGFSQIWKNLISNAVKYNENSAPKVEIGFTTTNGNQRMYHFYVRDNGIGIDEKHLDRIFMPFQRASKDPKYEGTGIGLAIVKRVIELHGGRIWVESRKNEGTTFHFTIPKPILT
jgi:chemotaxis family two-component system sensor kinase Cph1